MIFMYENECPTTRAEAFALQEPFRELYTQMDMVGCAIDALAEHYFSVSSNNIKKNKAAQKLFIEQYRQMKLQIGIISVLFEECVEYMAMIRGANTPYGEGLERTVECKKKIRKLFEEG